MKSPYLIGAPGSGKTAVALGLALKLRKEGVNAGYFKPVGTTAGVLGKHDDDGVLMQKVLGMDEDLETIVPFTVANFYISNFKHPDKCRERVLQCYNRIAAKYEVVIIDGTSFPWVMASFGLDAITLAAELGAGILCTIQVENDFDFDEALFFNRHAESRGVAVVGTIFNNIPRQMLAKTEGVYSQLLTGFGYEFLGAIPSRREIYSPTVAEYQEALNGEVLAGEEHLDLLVEDVLVGAMTIESALDTLRRALNKAVIIGGDRSDYALAALETSTSVLILTGGLYPNIRVIARAEEKGVPVILVHYDTVTTVERISEVTRRIKPKDSKAIAMALENIEQYCRWEAILERLRA
ncbi:MAG: phosphotransacetylase family protein [Bacillota bacterium]|nr:phosphotransacetylase family protein [Bacillota bacterium]